MLRAETKRRARALQLLYAWETRGRPPLSDLVLGLARLTGPEPTLLDQAEALSARVIGAEHALDELIQEAAEHWRLDRIGLMERMILRLGCAELQDPSVPPRTAIDESLWLTHRFVGPAAVPFVNGVLDRVGQRLGRL
ncbi:MAG: transcription antitermination factor NusB [Gemmatimonadota bacterium]